ncbi:choline/glycine/proline betaine transport protein [Microcella alkaliphila]|uniref:Choline/glycine/proline betaine transport protein n=1 Tax=Microcella alkaliphila TaxID=279828 RepID=A0A4Q7TTL2_9MICO|nr:choline/glycine/proline betaine transport protein [Microcella alkaliphila]
MTEPIARTPSPASTAPPAERYPIKRWVFWPAAVLTVGFVAFTLVAPDAAETGFGAVQASIISWFNWYYVLIAAFFVVFGLWAAFSRYGRIRLGTDDDEPEFGYRSWFALLFAAGMGIGLVFWGVAEPLNHFANPRPGVEGTDIELAQAAMSQTYLHWGVHAWAIYVALGLGLAYAIHRRGRPISVRWTLEPLFGKRVRGGLGNVIDVVALVGTLFGVATSLGLGVLQIGAGLEAAGIAEANDVTLVAVIAVISVAVLASVLSGINRGMKWLSNINLALAGFLVVFLLVVGPTQFLLRQFVQSIGNYLGDFIALSFTVSAFAGAEGEAWQAGWTSFYWGWWIAWAPFVGIFIARISKGRTVREFVVGVMLVPTIITFLWFSVLGGTAIYTELYGAGGLVSADGGVDTEGALFAVLGSAPGGAALILGAILLISIFFITSADSGSLVMGMLATGGDPEPRRWVRAFFVVVVALLAISLLLVGGLSALQTASIIAALPFSVVLLLACAALVVAFRREGRIADRAERAELVDEIGDHYGLEVDPVLTDDRT